MKIVLVGDNYYRRIYDPLIHLGYEVKLIPYNYKVSKFIQPFMYLYKIFQTYIYTLIMFKPDIVVFTNPSYISFFSIDFLRFMKKRVAMRLGADLKNDFEIVISNLEAFSLKKIIKIMQYKMFAYSVKKSDKLLTTSKYVKQQIAKSFNISLSDINCIYTPVKPQKQLSIQEKENIILSITQFNNPLKTKGTADAIKHLSSWLKSNPNYRYLIIGAGKNIRKINKWKKQNYDLPNIIFEGYVSNVEEWYLKSKVFIHISYRDGFPKVVLEAQSFGLPVIANNDVGMREQIINNYNGYLIDNEELDRINEYLDTLLQDEKQYTNMANNCINHILENYNIDIISRNIKDALKPC